MGRALDWKSEDSRFESHLQVTALQNLVNFVYLTLRVSFGRDYKGICQEKCHFGFSKSSKFKRVVLLVLMTFCVYIQ